MRAFHWIITAVINVLQLATSYLTLSDAVASHFLIIMLEDISCGRGKDVILFQKGQIIAPHQAKKSKETAETAKIGLRTVQRIIET